MEQIFYPKQLLVKRQRMQENQCFFAMPFSDEYNNLYNLLCIYLKNENYIPIRVDENSEAGVPIITLILNGIAKSQYIIVDISESNANVFYELGIAQTIKESNNIFIIKEISAKAPFDIQHLQYIPYDKNNLKNLAEEIIKRLKANQYKNDFCNALASQGIMDEKYIDDFAAYCVGLFNEEDITFITDILTMNESGKTYLINTERASFFNYDKALREEIKKHQNENVIIILQKLFCKLITSCCEDVAINNYIQEYLHLSEYEGLRKELLCSFQTDLAIELASQSKLEDISLTWIIDYFQKSKSTKVDLNRYKLESFLLKSDIQSVNEHIVNAILSDNHYIREHMSDIAGEKKLQYAEENLLIQLSREENIYTTASIMEALGKIHSKKGAASIATWVNKNDKKIIMNGNFFVLKHARNAFVNINESKFLEEFDKQYYNILRKNNAI